MFFNIFHFYFNTMKQNMSEALKMYHSHQDRFYIEKKKKLIEEFLKIIFLTSQKLIA